jgi:putative nucleotidyltransferase with HDIG domain
MISRERAKLFLEKELHDSRRIGHSLAVAGMMESLARQFKADPEEWYLTGLLHDIDLPETMDRLAMHGIVAGEKLKGLLPERLIRAIMAHDYRTGIQAKTELARALVFADNLENLGASIGRERIEACRREKAWDELREEFPGKKRHVDALEEYFREFPGIEA